MQWKSLLYKKNKQKQDDCMKESYIDSMTYTWASFMHGDMADVSDG